MHISSMFARGHHLQNSNRWLKVLEEKRRRDAGESLDPKDNASNTSQVCNRRV